MIKSIINYIDRFTKFLIVLTGDHNYIHRGYGFSIIDTVTTILSGNSVRFGLTTPPASSGFFIHFRPTKVSVTAGPVQITVYEDVPYSGGVSVTPFNRNRNSTNVAQTSVATGVTAAPSATQILYQDITGSIIGGSNDGSAEEVVFLPDTSYVIEYTNAGASTTALTATVFWYEEEKG